MPAELAQIESDGVPEKDLLKMSDVEPRNS